MNRIKLTILLIFIGSMAFSQTTNFRRVENAHIINSISGDTLSSHSSDIEAVQQLQNYEKKGLEVRMLGAVYEVDNVSLTMEIDTVELHRRVDVDGDCVGGYLDRVKGNGYFLTYEDGMVCYPTDSIPSWQRAYNFKRTKEFGKVSYENLTIPFQIRDIWIDKTDDSTYAVNLTTTEYPKQTSCYLNGELYKQFTPGSFRKDGEVEYFGIWGLYDLDATIDYEVRTVVEGVSGEIMESIINIIR